MAKSGAQVLIRLSETHKGTLESISLRRIHPLPDRLNLGVTIGKQWYILLLISILTYKPQLI